MFFFQWRIYFHTSLHQITPTYTYQHLTILYRFLTVLCCWFFSKTSLFIGAFKILTFLWLETFVTTFNRMQLFYAIRQYTIKITVWLWNSKRSLDGDLPLVKKIIWPFSLWRNHSCDNFFWLFNWTKKHEWIYLLSFLLVCVMIWVNM